MKVLLSIKPEYVSKIFSGKKKFEFRKKIFKNRDVKTILVYSTMPVGMVIGEFQIDEILSKNPSDLWNETRLYAGVKKDFYDSYFSGRELGYAIKVKKINQYETPRKLKTLGVKQAPQSFLYIK